MLLRIDIKQERPLKNVSPYEKKLLKTALNTNNNHKTQESRRKNNKTDNLIPLKITTLIHLNDYSTHQITKTHSQFIYRQIQTNKINLTMFVINFVFINKKKSKSSEFIMSVNNLILLYNYAVFTIHPLTPVCPDRD